jgi:hypothetical protein
MPEADLVNVISALIENPIMLFYEIKVNDNPSKFIYTEGDVEMVFEDEEEQKQYQDDQELAKKLQQQLDDEEEKKYKPYSTRFKSPSKKDDDQIEVDEPKEVVAEISKLESNEWKCKNCTLVNKLPLYRCGICNEMDLDAFDKKLLYLNKC